MASPQKQVVGVEMPRTDSTHGPLTPTTPARCRMRIHLAFGVVGVVALLCEGLVLHFLLTTEFNDSLDQMIKEQQENLLLGAKTTMMDKVNGWLKLSAIFADKFQRRLSLDPSMILSDIWKPAFEANISRSSDTDGVALANAVQFDDSVAVIAIHRDGSNYRGDPSKPVDYNLSDSTVFAYFHRIYDCPSILMRGESNDVRYSTFCYDFTTGKAGRFVNDVLMTDENGLDRRFAVDVDQEALWNRIKAAEGRYTLDWLYYPLAENYTPLQFVAVKMHQLSDGRNISASVVNTAENIAEEVVSQMCSWKWDAGEFCESLLVGHLNFDILTWGSNNEVSGVVNDIEQFSSTSAIRMVYSDLDSQVHNTDSFDDVILGLQVGPWLYSAERIFPASHRMADDGGSIWIILIYDRDEIYEESDAVAQTAIVTLVLSMVVSVFTYILMLGYYTSRIRNLRRTLRAIQSAPMEESTELVDKFVDNSRIYEVYQIANEFGSVIHALADSNEEKRIAQEEQLAERAFLAYMSHHIRTPLHGVLGTCEVVLVRTKEPETKEYLQAVMQCGNSLLVLLNDSIDLSRMQANKMEIEVAPVKISEVLKVVHSTFQTELERVGRDLRTVNMSGQDLYCMGDSARLVQITTNLVSNAIKYSKNKQHNTGDARNPVYICSHFWNPSEGAVMTKLLDDAATNIPSAKVAFHAQDVLTKQVGKPPIAGNEYVVISVTDFGRGIPENKLVKLFSPFAQMRTEDSECGAGLGLNMCFHVAILLGGFTGVISREGRGSIFFIAMPATTAPKLHRVEEKTNEDVHKSDTIVVDKDNDTVLVVDDTKVNRLILSRHLESLGLRSIQACDGQEAVDMVIQHNGHFRCVLTDLDMPVMDGLTAASLIKRDYPDLPIMCVSANSTPKDVQLAKDAGCVGLMGKPFTRIMLKKAVAMMA